MRFGQCVESRGEGGPWYREDAELARRQRVST
jgi:hypothetical protein